MITMERHGPNDSTFCQLQHKTNAAFTSHHQEKSADGIYITMFQVGSAGSNISLIPIGSYNMPWNLPVALIAISNAHWKWRMAEIFCQGTSDAPTESPPYDIQTHPVPTKSIIYGPIVDVERFSGYWLDLLSVIPPAGITFGLLGCLCNTPKISKISWNKSLPFPNSPSHHRNSF